MSQAREPREGDVLRDYILHERLGAGGAGVVFRASHRLVPERVVALKIPHAEEAVELLRAEAVAQARIACAAAAMTSVSA